MFFSIFVLKNNTSICIKLFLFCILLSSTNVFLQAKLLSHFWRDTRMPSVLDWASESEVQTVASNVTSEVSPHGSGTCQTTPLSKIPPRRDKINHQTNILSENSRIRPFGHSDPLRRMVSQTCVCIKHVFLPVFIQTSKLQKSHTKGSLLGNEWLQDDSIRIEVKCGF